MKESKTPVQFKQSISLHISKSSPKQRLPKIKSLHNYDKKEPFFPLVKKKINLMAFNNEFQNFQNSISLDPMLREKNDKEKKPQNKTIILPNYGKKISEILKLCNNDSLLKQPIMNPKFFYESPSKKLLNSSKQSNSQLNENSFNLLRKRAFRINNIWDENCNSQYISHIKQNSVKMSNKFLKNIKRELSEKKYCDLHVKKLEKAREVYYEKLPSPKKEMDYFEKIKKQEIKRIKSLHNDKLSSINNYANMIENEASGQNKIFKNIFQMFSNEYESILK